VSKWNRAVVNWKAMEFFSAIRNTDSEPLVVEFYVFYLFPVVVVGIPQLIEITAASSKPLEFFRIRSDLSLGTEAWLAHR
jgi:hypothetical protein